MSGVLTERQYVALSHKNSDEMFTLLSLFSLPFAMSSSGGRRRVRGFLLWTLADKRIHISTRGHVIFLETLAIPLDDSWSSKVSGYVPNCEFRDGDSLIIQGYRIHPCVTCSFRIINSQRSCTRRFRLSQRAIHFQISGTKSPRIATEARHLDRFSLGRSEPQVCLSDPGPALTRSECIRNPTVTWLPRISVVHHA